MSSYGLGLCVEKCICFNCAYRGYTQLEGCLGSKCRICVPDEPQGCQSNGDRHVYIEGYKHHDCKVRKELEDE